MKKTRCINTPIVLAVSTLLAIILVSILCTQLISKPGENADPTVPEATQATEEQVHLPDLLGIAKSIKGNLLSAIQDIKQNNFESARTKLDAVQNDISSVRAFADNIPLLMKLIPQAKSICELLDAADKAIPDVILPAIDLLEIHPLSALKVGEGYDTKLICVYIDFVEDVMPNLEALIQTANAVDFSLLDSEGEIAEAMKAANELLTVYYENPEIFSVLKAMLGANGDRIYLIAVQNPSEIRASGGFPGSMSTVRIEDGILTLGDFSTVRNFLRYKTPDNIKITQEEYALFSYLSGVHVPWDADLCPDFERVGHIWASSYEEKNKESISGVISVTPHIVQRILATIDGEIELSDGLILNGDNAVKVLIHDIYFKYYSRNHYIPNRDKISDQLFAEAAEETMKTLTDNLSVSRLLEYLPVMKESFEDRTLILWMKNEDEQSFVVDMGWHGGLNEDSENPEAGVYVNVVSASKMGWFLLMDTQIGERTKNADGSYTYPITVTFNNNITEEEIKLADSYVSGNLNGAMKTVAYFFAPAGGKVGNFSATNGQNIKITTYNGSNLGFMDIFSIKPNQTITITYTVTTAPGVDTPLVISKTPTAQQS